MRLSGSWLSDYRLPVYVVAAAVIAASMTFAFDRLTAPATKVEANKAPPSVNGVRQIPIARTSAADLGDPQGKLTPIYPTSPGKDLPVKDTPVIQAAKPAATTTGSASASSAATPTGQTASPAAPVQTSAAAPAANACNVAACAAAYRSFRESDCSYQPLVGERRYCAGAPGLGGQASAPAAPQPQAQRTPIDPRSTAPVARNRYDDELRNAERMVRRLPPPGAYDGEDPRGIVVMEAPEQRYDLRRNWISEPLD